jgi:hypothetical protein
MFFDGNSTSTTITTQGAYVQAAGTTTAGALNQRFSHTSGRLTYESALAETFRVSAIVSLTSGNNRVIAIRAYKNGALIDSRVSKSTTSGNGRAENVTYSVTTQLEQDDYIEVFVANTSNADDVTIEDLSVTVVSLT